MKHPYMIFGFRAYLRAAFLMALPVLGFGALTWENRRIEIVAKPGEKQLRAIFPFKNSGTMPVTITEVRPSCGCTTADLPKHTYAAGESGELAVVYDLGDANGQQRKLIHVKTDDPTSASTDLILVVTIPDQLVYSPRMLLWRIGDKLDEKAAVITSPTSRKISRVEVQSISPDKEAVTRIESDQKGDSFMLFVRPHSALKTNQVAITCLATFADGGSETLTVYALVR